MNLPPIILLFAFFFVLTILWNWHLREEVSSRDERIRFLLSRLAEQEELADSLEEAIRRHRKMSDGDPCLCDKDLHKSLPESEK